MCEALFAMDWPEFLRQSLGETGKAVIVEATQIAQGAKGVYNLDTQIATVAQPFPLGPGLFFWDAWYRMLSSWLLPGNRRPR